MSGKSKVLSESEQRFRRIFEEGLIGVVIVGSDKKFQEANPAFCRLIGYTSEELTSLTLADITHPDHIRQDSDNLRKMSTGEIPYYATEKRYIRKDGAIIWGRLVASAIRDESGKIIHFLAMVEDITTRKEMDEQLRQSEEKFRTLYETMIEGVAIHEVIYDEKGKAVNYRIIDVNPAYEKQTGISPESARGKLATDLYGTESAPYLPLWSRVAETSQPHHMDLFFAPMNKHFRVACCSPRKGWFATVFTDVTEQKLTEEQLRQSEEKFRALVETTSDWIWETDRNFVCTYASPRSTEILGYTPEEVIGKTPMNFMPPEEVRRVQPLLANLFSAARPFSNFEYQCLHKNGSLVTLEASGVPVFNSAGRLAGYRGVDRDITGRKKTEAAIQELNRELEERVIDRTRQFELANRELRSFAYSVSHDLRAPLRSIDGFSRALIEDYTDALDAQGQDYLHRLRRASQRMATLIDDLLKLSRVTSVEVRITDIDLSQLSSMVLSDLKNANRERTVTTSVQPGLIIRADQHLIQVAMENLLGNAWKFTSKRQQATIEFGALRQDEQTVYYVRDNGAGFNMEFAGKLFGVFQRLHSPDDYPGDGIGLASVQRIIQRHGGQVWGEGSPDKGATFYFTLNSEHTKQGGRP